MSLFKNLILFIVSIVLCFILAEIFVSFFYLPSQVVEIKHVKVANSKSKKEIIKQEDGGIDSIFNWASKHGIRLKPNIKATIKNHRLTSEVINFDTNSLGLRAPELGKKLDDEYRILVLGDSITISDYLNYEDMYTTQLEGLLNSGRNEKKITVINAGLPGASTYDEFYHYLEIKDLVEADLIILAMYLNDVQNSEKIYLKKLKYPFSRSKLISLVYNRYQNYLKSYLQEELIPRSIRKDWAEEFKKNSESLGRVVKSGDMMNDQGAFDFEIYNARMDFGLAWNEKSWDTLEEIIDAFKNIVETDNAEFKMLLFPVHLQVFGRVENYYPQEKFMELCRNLDLDCLDLRPSLEEAGKEYGRKMYFDHCHFGKEASLAVAHEMARWLE